MKRSGVFGAFLGARGTFLGASWSSGRLFGALGSLEGSFFEFREIRGAFLKLPGAFGGLSWSFRVPPGAFGRFCLNFRGFGELMEVLGQARRLSMGAFSTSGASRRHSWVFWCLAYVVEEACTLETMLETCRHSRVSIDVWGCSLGVPCLVWGPQAKRLL